MTARIREAGRLLVWLVLFALPVAAILLFAFPWDLLPRRGAREALVLALPAAALILDGLWGAWSVLRFREDAAAAAREGPETLHRIARARSRARARAGRPGE